MDSIDDYFGEAYASEVPVEDESDPNSQTPEECCQLISKLREDTESEIMPDCFAIMDDRTGQQNMTLYSSPAQRGVLRVNS